MCLITEIATLTIDPANAARFEAAVASAAPLFQRAKGCRGMALERTIEAPERYHLVVQWDQLEDHMVTFRDANDFQRWRELAGPYFTEAPTVVHVKSVANYF